MTEIIAFDLNKTLIRENSWYDLNMAVGITPEEDEHLYRLGPEGSGDISYAEWIGRLTELMVERGRADRQTIEGAILNYRYLDGVQETISALRKREDTLIGLITGALSPIAEQVTTDLAFDFMYCNATTCFDGNDMLERIDLKNDDFAFKVDAVSDLQRRHPDVRSIYYVADGDNDEAVFAVTKGIMITPDQTIHESWKQQALTAGDRLSAYRAARVAWKIVGSIRDVPGLLS